jgi:hypothetical protein
MIFNELARLKAGDGFVHRSRVFENGVLMYPGRRRKWWELETVS